MRWHPVWLHHLQSEEALQYRQHQAHRLNSPQVTLGKFVGMYILKAFHFEDQKHSGVTTSTGSH